MPTLIGRQKIHSAVLPQPRTLKSRQQSTPQGHGAPRGAEAAKAAAPAGQHRRGEQDADHQPRPRHRV